MIKNVYNNGQSSPEINLSANYLNYTSKALKLSLETDEHLYDLADNSVTVLKVEIKDFNTKMKVSGAKLRFKIKNVQEGGATFKLYETNEDSFSKEKSYNVELTSLLDTIVYNGNASKYGDVVADVIEFDITKYMYNKLCSEDLTLYFAITSNSKNYKLYSIEDLIGKEISLLMQLNNVKGLNSMYEYMQEDIGFAGVSSINLFNGNMIHKFEQLLTLNDKMPVAFNLFYNKDYNIINGMLGKYWTHSGNYRCVYNGSSFTVIDPSCKENEFYLTTEEEIKQVYNITELVDDIENPLYYICYNEPLYAIMSRTNESHIIIVDKYKNKMEFDNYYSNHVLEKISLNSGEYNEYNYYYNGKLGSIRNHDSEKIMFSYDNLNVSKVEIYNSDNIKIGQASLSYDNNYLKNIKLYSSDETTLINEVNFNYDEHGRLNEIKSILEGIGRKIQYSTTGQVVKIENINLDSNEDQMFTTYDYFTFQTRLTDYTGFYVDYYFDNYGRCKNIIDCEAKSITRNYEEVINGNPGNLSMESKVQINERNIIANHSFDNYEQLFGENSPWTLESGESEKIKIVDGGVFGKKCLRIVKDSGNTVRLIQSLYNVPQGIYTFKGYLKAVVDANSTMKPGSIKAKIVVKYKERETTVVPGNYYTATTETTYQEKEEVYDLINTISGTFDWNEFKKNIVSIPGGPTIQDLDIKLIIELTESNYTAFIDDLTLTYGDHIVRHNYVSNGYFENELSGWEKNNTSDSDKIVYSNLCPGHHTVLGDNVLRISSDLNKVKKVYTTIDIKGNPGDELLLNLFGKGNVSTNDVFKAFVKIYNANSDDYKEYEFEFDSNFENWQVLTRKIISNFVYDNIEIGVKVRAKTDVYIDAVQLYKDTFGKEYAYTEKKNLSEIIDSNGNFASVSYDENSNITEATDEFGDSYRYSYKNNKLTQITNNQNSKVLLKYDDDIGKRTETKIISSKGEILKTSQSYDSKGRVQTSTDDLGVVKNFEYDEYDRVTKETIVNGSTTVFKYDVNGLLQEQLSKLGSIQSKCNYIYDTYGRIKSIECDDETIYEFEYNQNQQLSNIKVDGVTFVKNYYEKYQNSINTNLLTKQILGDNDSNGYYTFNYDDKQRLTQIYFNDILQVEYEYDEKDRVAKIIDKCSNKDEFLSYDNEGNLVSVYDNNGDCILFDYDNLNNLQKATFNFDDVLRSFDYEYKCEYNDYTPSGYFNRLQKLFPDEIIKGGSGLNGVYGARTAINNVECDTIEVDDNSALTEKVPSINFVKNNSLVSYELESFNKERKPSSTTDKVFNYDSWKSKFRNRKTVYAWIKPTLLPRDKQRLFAFSALDDSGFRFVLSVNKNNTLVLEDKLNDIELTTTEDIDYTLNVNEWNLVGFKVDFDFINNSKTISIILNGRLFSKTYLDEISLDSLKFFVIGEHCISSNYTDIEYLTGTKYQNNMPFKLAFLSVGGTDIQGDEFIGIYEEGIRFLTSEPNFGASGVTFFDESVYKGFDVITLNGSLNSLKRMQPKEYIYIENTFSSEKINMFKFDTVGLDPLYRHVYASYDSGVNLNRVTSSKLAYDLLLRNSGTISLRFKVDQLNDSDNNDRVILYSGNGTQQKMKLYIDSNNNLCFADSVNNYNLFSSVLLDKWHLVTIRFTGSNLLINLDDNSVQNITTVLNLDNIYTYIGCSIDSTNLPIEHLNGCIEMLAFKDSFASDVEIQNIYNNGESFSVRTYYDELGRTSSRRVHSKNNVLRKNYYYTEKNGCTSTKISSEESYSGEQIHYEYDELGNLKNVEIEDELGNVVNKNYTYDGLFRLKSSIVNGITNTYDYYPNNNIKKKNNILYYYDGRLKDQLTSRSDGTTITYDESGFIGNPLKIDKPNQKLELVWNGRRLISLRDTFAQVLLNFDYNANGIRIVKEVEEEYTEKYSLSGSKILTLKRITNNLEKVLNFVYDETESLVGFTFNGDEYFYDRAVDGEIRHIVDKTGKVYVSYTYDDWGLPTISYIEETKGRELSELNPFMYKGYFYDREIKMYYLNTRYYDPDLGRFINADSQVGSIGQTMGMNLYAYCRNNPICYADENGNWPSWATKVCIGVAVIAICAVVAVASVYTGGAAACLASSMLAGAVKGALIGAATGALSGAVVGAVTEGIKTKTWEGAWKGALSGAIDGAADGFMWGAIGGAISGAMNPKFCFVAGTLVMTKQGLKAIEEIKVGDQVLSYNDNLDIFEYKDVVDVYNNETTELCHIQTETEEIVCTPNHSILTDEGWKLASELETNDNIKTSNGFAKVVFIEIEQLKEKINVYNLNVLGYHTYVVGNELLVAHNSCNPNGRKGCKAHQDKISELREQLTNTYNGFDINTEVMVKTSKGMKSKRFVDIAVMDSDGKIIKGYQVGVSTKKGLPVIRERRALSDLADALGDGIIEFISYK